MVLFVLTCWGQLLLACSNPLLGLFAEGADKAIQCLARAHLEGEIRAEALSFEEVLNLYQAHSHYYS